MIRKVMLTAIAVALIVPAGSFAKDMTGKFALGFYSSDAPVAVRYWATDKIAVDAGLGLSVKEVPDYASSDSTATTNAFSFWFEAGVPIKVWDHERAHFFVRPGVLVGILDDREFGTEVLDKTWTQVTGQLALGAEVFLTENFSLDANHGFNLVFTSPPDEVGDSTFDVKTFGGGLTNVGFRFYF